MISFIFILLYTDISDHSMVETLTSLVPSKCSVIQGMKVFSESELSAVTFTDSNPMCLL